MATPIVNGLLCYAIHHINSGAESDIEHILFKFYEHNDTVEAKKALWQVCKDDLDPYEARKKSDTRSAQEAHIHDIMKALKKLEALNKIPEVYVKDLDTVPDRQPADLNYAMLVQRVADLMKFKADSNDLIARMSNDILELQEAQRSSNCTGHAQPAPVTTAEPATGREIDQQGSNDQLQQQPDPQHQPDTTQQQQQPTTQQQTTPQQTPPQQQQATLQQQTSQQQQQQQSPPPQDETLEYVSLRP